MLVRRGIYVLDAYFEMVKSPEILGTTVVRLTHNHPKDVHALGRVGAGSNWLFSRATARLATPSNTFSNGWGGRRCRGNAPDLPAAVGARTAQKMYVIPSEMRWDAGSYPGRPSSPASIRVGPRGPAHQCLTPFPRIGDFGGFRGDFRGFIFTGNVRVRSAAPGRGVRKKHAGEGDLDPAETLRVNLITEPPTLDWTKSPTSFRARSPTTSWMVWWTSISRTPSCARSRAGHLVAPNRPGARLDFQNSPRRALDDGALFTGQHVIDGWERLLNPANASPGAYIFVSGQKRPRYNSGEIKDFKEVGVRLSAPDELRVELEEPMGYFPLLMTSANTFPVRKDLIERFGDAWTDRKIW